LPDRDPDRDRRSSRAHRDEDPQHVRPRRKHAVFSAVENLATGGHRRKHPSADRRRDLGIGHHKKKIEVPLPRCRLPRAEVTDLLKEAGPMDTDALRAARHEFTATQRNTFFDNAISRILLRGGLGGIEQQTGRSSRPTR
jgi:hypothetical protein